MTKSKTRRMGYTRIESSRAGRHLPRPCGERINGEAHDTGMPDARSNRRGGGFREGGARRGLNRLCPSPRDSKCAVLARKLYNEDKPVYLREEKRVLNPLKWRAKL